ncbi:MAG: response regulator [Rhodomicrobium sp.]
MYVAEAASERHEAFGHRPKVLLVEDEAIIRLALASELRGARYEVIEASNADEALEILESVPVDLLISDFFMPGSMDGLQLAECARESCEKLKIIMLSGHLPQPPSAKLADCYFPKPYRSSAVLASCRDLLHFPG